MGDEPVLIRQYAAWLSTTPTIPESERRQFFTDGVVVLDSNVLLSLYEYTAHARDEVLGALEQVGDRLWMPHQVGLEFVRGRHRVIAARTSTMKGAPGEINRRINESMRAVIGASDFVKQLLIKYAQDDVSVRELDQQFSRSAVDSHFSTWRNELLKQVDKMKADQDVALGSVASDDPVLPRVATLYGNRIAPPPPFDVLRHRVNDAMDYRFPNRIPPGFSDEGKQTPLQAAGDLLLWEEVIAMAAADPAVQRVLFISSDTKSDWYEPEEPGRDRRPWPMLNDELRNRASAELCVHTPREFFEGVKLFLDAEIADETYDEIDRASAEVDIPDQDLVRLVTEDNVLEWEPPRGLALQAFRGAGLTTRPSRTAIESRSRVDRPFQWWLIGATAQLHKRTPSGDEPLIDLLAATRSNQPPGPLWQSAQRLRIGEWPYRSSSWVAPWFMRVLETLPEADRRILLRLAAQQIDRESAK